MADPKPHPTPRTVNLAKKFATFTEHWSPKLVGRVNDMAVKLVKFQGEFVWHHHEEEDELFLVVKGSFTMRLETVQGELREVRVGEGEFIVVPRGTKHQPYAEHEVEVMLLEPASTLNTGNVTNERTVRTLEQI